MTARLLALALLLLAPAAATGPAAAPAEVGLALALGPGNEGGPVLALAGAPIRLVALFQGASAVSDDVHVTAERGRVTPERTRVSFPAGGEDALPLRLVADPAAAGGSVTLAFEFASTRGADGAPLRLVREVPLAPPVSFRLASPRPPVAMPGVPLVALHVPAAAPLEFVLEATNVADRASPPIPVGVYRPWTPLGNVTMPPIDPGATRSVVAHRFVLDETPGVAIADEDSPVMFGFGHPAPAGGVANVWSFEYDDGWIRNLTALPTFLVVFHRDVTAHVVEAEVALGEASRVTVRLENLGGKDRHRVPVEIAVTPLPPGRYGDWSGARETRRVDLPAGASAEIRLGFVPRVATTHVVTVSFTVDRWTRPIEHVLHLSSDVTVPSFGDQPLRARLHEPVGVPLAFEGPAERVAPRLAVAVADRDGALTLAHLLDADDVLDVHFDRAEVTLGDGAGGVTATLTPRAAGKFLLVPWVASGEVGKVAMVAGKAEERPAVLQLEVNAAPLPVLSAWIPFAIVAAAFLGFGVWRWR